MEQMGNKRFLRMKALHGPMAIIVPLDFRCRKITLISTSRALFFAKQIIEKYSGTVSYDTGAASFVFLRNFSAQAQSESESVDLSNITLRLIALWHLEKTEKSFTICGGTTYISALEKEIVFGLSTLRVNSPLYYSRLSELFSRTDSLKALSECRLISNQAGMNFNTYESRFLTQNRYTGITEMVFTNNQQISDYNYDTATIKLKKEITNNDSTSLEKDTEKTHEIIHRQEKQSSQLSKLDSISVSQERSHENELMSLENTALKTKQTVLNTSESNQHFDEKASQTITTKLTTESLVKTEKDEAVSFEDTHTISHSENIEHEFSPIEYSGMLVMNSVASDGFMRIIEKAFKPVMTQNTAVAQTSLSMFLSQRFSPLVFSGLNHAVALLTEHNLKAEDKVLVYNSVSAVFLKSVNHQRHFKEMKSISDMLGVMTRHERLESLLMVYHGLSEKQAKHQLHKSTIKLGSKAVESRLLFLLSRDHDNTVLSNFVKSGVLESDSFFSSLKEFLSVNKHISQRSSQEKSVLDSGREEVLRTIKAVQYINNFNTLIDSNIQFKLRTVRPSSEFTVLRRTLLKSYLNTLSQSFKNGSTQIREGLSLKSEIFNQLISSNMLSSIDGDLIKSLISKSEINITDIRFDINRSITLPHFMMSIKKHMSNYKMQNQSTFKTLLSKQNSEVNNQFASNSVLSLGNSLNTENNSAITLNDVLYNLTFGFVYNTSFKSSSEDNKKHYFNAENYVEQKARQITKSYLQSEIIRMTNDGGIKPSSFGDKTNALNTIHSSKSRYEKTKEIFLKSLKALSEKEISDIYNTTIQRTVTDSRSELNNEKHLLITSAKKLVDYNERTYKNTNTYRNSALSERVYKSNIIQELVKNRHTEEFSMLMKNAGYSDNPVVLDSISLKLKRTESISQQPQQTSSPRQSNVSMEELVGRFGNLIDYSGAHVQEAAGGEYGVAFSGIYADKASIDRETREILVKTSEQVSINKELIEKLEKKQEQLYEQSLRYSDIRHISDTVLHELKKQLRLDKSRYVR